MSVSTAPRPTLGDRAAFHGPALLFFTALTFLLAFPVVAALFSDRVPGWEGDNLYYARRLRDFRDQLRQRFRLAGTLVR